MAKTCTVISNHNLDTSNLANLAADLSARLQINISYGYYDDFDYDSILANKEATFTFTQLGFCKATNAAAQSQEAQILYEDEYVLRNFAEIEPEIYQDQLDSPMFPIFAKSIEQAKNNPSFTLMDPDINDGGGLSIFPDSLELNIDNYMAFWTFGHFFLYHSTPDQLEYLKEWRTNNRDWIYKFGGDTMIVGCHETKSATILEFAETNNWEQTINFIEENCHTELLNIPHHLLITANIVKPNYVQQPFDQSFFRDMRYRDKKGLPPVEYKTTILPLIYYDDFSDLDDSKPVAQKLIIDFKSEIIPPARPEPLIIERDSVELILDPDDFLVYKGSISGLQYYQFHQVDLELNVNQQLQLVREPKNKHDKYAIELFYDSEDEYCKLGYLPSQANNMLARFMDNGFKFKCFIAKINDEEINDDNLYNALQIAIYTTAKL